jgi:hypothetical protein
MSAEHRLGGWLRLWFVLVVIYAVAVTAGAISTAPSAKDLFAAWTSEILQTLEADVKRTTGSEIAAAQFRSSNEFMNKSDEKIARDMTQNAKDIDLTKPGKQDLGPYQKDIAALAEKYERKLEILPAEQAKYAGIAFLLWLFPSLCVLALGYAVGWVIRGFKNV